MRRSLIPLSLLLAALFACSCRWDVTQFALHSDVEDRARQSLSGEAGAPDTVAVPADSVRFAVFADLHVGRGAHDYLADYRRHADSLGIAFSCVAGDITHKALPAEFDTAEARLGRLGPYYVTLGNHDLYQAGGWQEYRTHFGPSCYSVPAGPRVRLIFLDTGEGRLGSTQFDWLERQLADTTWSAPARHSSLVTHRWTVVITHFPLFDGELPGIYRMGSAAERAKLQSLLQRHGANAIVSGHIHGWRHTVVGGVSHFIIGTITDALDYGTPGYLLFTFAGDSLRWQHVEF
ncbi:metallophosphoesterase [candidate division WOR-3 bacterium]|nr:metallophosphoesterase [candidate division WOR-3 bacterium]